MFCGGVKIILISSSSKLKGKIRGIEMTLPQRYITVRPQAAGNNYPVSSSSSKISPSLLEEWDKQHHSLRSQLTLSDTETWQHCDNLNGLERVAGVDISTSAEDCDAEECDAFAAVVICRFPTMEIIHQETEKIRLEVPYVPGYLAFRESAPVINLLQRISYNYPEYVPDVLFVDGNGVLHPQRCGLACHIGLQTSIPSIGVAKNLHLLEGVDLTNRKMVQDMETVGDHVLIRDENDETIGMALKTAVDAKNPMYISTGHKISLDTAKKVVLKCCKYRIPEPIRFADNISRELIRRNEKRKQSQSRSDITK